MKIGFINFVNLEEKGFFKKTFRIINKCGDVGETVKVKETTSTTED